MAVKTVHQAGANENGLQDMAGGNRGARLHLVLGEKTGWALCASNGQVSSGVREFHPDGYGEEGSQFMAFLEWLRQVQREAGPMKQVTYTENRYSPFWPVDGSENGFLWHLLTWVREYGILLVGAPPASIKLGMTGRINASDQEVAQAVSSRGWHAKDPAEIEALALMVTMEEHPLWGGKRVLVVYTDTGEEMEHE